MSKKLKKHDVVESTVKLFSHKCTKCGTSYEDADDEAYLCGECLAERKRIAAKIDKQRGHAPVIKTPSELEKYDSSQKIRGFVSAKSLGL